MWFGFRTWNLSFSSPFFFFFKFRPPSVILGLFFVLHLSLSLFVAQCLSPDPVEKAASIYPPCFLFQFVLYLFLSIWLETRWQPFCLTGSINSPSCQLCLVSLFLHPKLTPPPSIFLFFLNVIVKCSSEMTLNMCTLTEGIHLVIYFLTPVSPRLSLRSPWLSIQWDVIQEGVQNIPW